MVYDEVEFFRDFSHPDFNYPYTDRKTHEAKFDFDFTLDVLDYTFDSTEMYFIKSTVCLEDPFYTQLFFLSDLFN